jgi:hypothetical protein
LRSALGMSSTEASSTAQHSTHSSLHRDGCTAIDLMGLLMSLAVARPLARSRRLAFSQNAGARAAQRLRSRATRREGAVGGGAALLPPRR